jgi:hypothetical protein
MDTLTCVIHGVVVAAASAVVVCHIV